MAACMRLGTPTHSDIHVARKMDTLTLIVMILQITMLQPLFIMSRTAQSGLEAQVKVGKMAVDSHDAPPVIEYLKFMARVSYIQIPLPELNHSLNLLSIPLLTCLGEPLEFT